MITRGSPLFPSGNGNPKTFTIYFGVASASNTLSNISVYEHINFIDVVLTSHTVITPISLP